MFLLYDIFLILCGIAKLLHIEIIENFYYDVYYNEIINSYHILFVLCLVSIVISLCFTGKYFMEMGISGGNPYSRYLTVLNFMYWFAKFILSIVALISYLLMKGESTILTIGLVLISIIGVIGVGIVIYLLINLIRKKIHKL